MVLPLPNAWIEERIHQIDQQRRRRHRHDGEADRSHQKIVVTLDDSRVDQTAYPGIFKQYFRDD